jgi:hypothetical protein
MASGVIEMRVDSHDVLAARYNGAWEMPQHKVLM